DLEGGGTLTLDALDPGAQSAHSTLVLHATASANQGTGAVTGTVTAHFNLTATAQVTNGQLAVSVQPELTDAAAQNVDIKLPSGNNAVVELKAPEIQFVTHPQTGGAVAMILGAEVSFPQFPQLTFAGGSVPRITIPEVDLVPDDPNNPAG